MARLILIRWLILPGIVLLFAVACEEEPVQPRALVNQAAPDFHLADLEGRPWKLCGLRGKVVMLSFWSPRCETCREGLARLETIHRRLRTSEQVYQLLSILYEDEPEAAKQLVRQAGITFPVLRDPGAKTAARCGVYILPTGFITDPQGILRKQRLGHQHWTEQELRDSLARYQP